MDLKKIRENFASLTDSQVLHIYQEEFNTLEDGAKELLLHEIQKRGIDKESTPEPPSNQEEIFAVSSSHPLRYFVYSGWIWGFLQIYVTFISFKMVELPFRIAVGILGAVWIIAATGVGKLRRWGYYAALVTASLHVAYNLILIIPITAREVSRLFFSGSMEFKGMPPQVNLPIWIFWVIYLVRPKTRNLFNK